MNGGFQPGAFQQAFQQLVAAVKGAGRALRPRRRYFVDVDGEEFEVASPEQAIELLHQATIVAEKAASKAAATVVREGTRVRYVGKGSPLPIKVPKVTGPPELREVVRKANDRIEQIYRAAIRDAEIALLMAIQAEREDEEALLSLI